MNFIEIEGKKYEVKLTFSALREIELVFKGDSIIETLNKKAKLLESGAAETTNLSATECYVIIKNTINIEKETLEVFIANNIIAAMGIATQILTKILYGKEEDCDKMEDETKKN
jgi:hypothetical protein